MPRRLIFLSVLAVPLALLTSCSSSLLSKGPNVLSDSEARRIAGTSAYARKIAKMPFHAAPATNAVVSAARGKAKDKHGMPVYTSTSERRRYVRTTAYTHTESDHLEFGIKNAAGTNLRFNHKVRSAAADWSVYPVGTLFRIRGLPYTYVVDDYGSALVGTQTVDMFMPDKLWMKAWGSRKVELTVVRWGSFERSAELLRKRTKYSHCRQMYAAIMKRRSGLAMVSN
jgi:3D (Asp-Asp-Asp) domain-containing protein